MFNVLDENERLLVAASLSAFNRETLGHLGIYFLFLSRSGAFSQTVFSKGCDENENDFGLHEKV